ncbi:piggyBac transposable element-derived protein 4-like [Hyla sarda]|uniref:piggyBac transposable element-derived protein 4-like n=1 Tax=Hyla sarda TaxID=327740 RepID=UPI0024C3B5F4|nr:piggyBac transposable element-derived protein 4-like [Hyla sarda]
MTKRFYSAEEAFEILFADSGSDSGEDLEFLASSSSSSDESPERRPGPSAQEQPSVQTWIPTSNFIPQIPNFTATPGIHVDTTGFREIHFFKLFFSDDLINLIVAETNLYAEQFIARNPSKYYAKPHKWTPTDATEMYKFWGLLLNMGLCKKPTIRSYWVTDILYHTPLYPLVMSRTRFEILFRFLHYNNNDECLPQSDPAFDRLFKIRPLITHFNSKFCQVYTPQKQISVDESLVHFKGRLRFRQYLPNKRARYGIKLYKLCESATGYTFRFRVYEGKDISIQPPECPSVLKTSGRIVWDLIHPLLDRGYHVYIDNFYNSVPLLKSLAARSTAACGTIRKNQKDLPKTFISTPVPRGQSRAVCTDTLMLLKYKDKRDVLVLTTLHGDQSTPVPIRGATEQTIKPVCIQDYNKYMGGVDLSDQVLQPYSALRKSKAWYKKVSVYLTQVGLYNSFVLYRNAGHRGTFLEFQEAVIRSLVFGEQEEEATTSSQMEVSRIVRGQHFPGKLPPTEKKRRPQKLCRVCYAKGVKKYTTHICETCPSNPGLCIGECFQAYHTAPDLKKL